MNDRLYLRDPQLTDLGKNILQYSILLIDQLGFENFTFRKLATEIGSAEKSIYRYFDNKHMLLLYLTSWYYEWVHYLIDFNTNNIEDPQKKLEIAIHNIVNASKESPLTSYINENILHKIVVSEGSKSYHVHNIDSENKIGLYLSYKNLVKQLSDIILERKPKFCYSKSLSSNLLEMANNQIFFAEHLPNLTDIKKRKKINLELEKMMVFFATKIIA
jgi:AcrR family transcriptional regulator